MSYSRRSFLGRTGWLAATAAAWPATSWAKQAKPARAGQRPGRVIHLVSDGMSLGTLTCADHFSRLTRQRGLTWLQMSQHPAAQTAWVNMRSLNSLVTDSAAASSSWGSGSRVVNGTLNVLPDGRELRTLLELAGQAGWRRGLVTTTEITHATPAGFAVSVGKRGDAELIAAGYLDHRIEVLLGGGRTFFDPTKRKDKRDLRAAYRQQGYDVMDRAWHLGTAPTDRPWLGLFADSHLPFTLDHQRDPKQVSQVPTLPAMTQAALKRLGRERHFILQVEGGRVDHAAHNCDAAAAMHDQIAFDEALELCLEFQQRAPDTLLVVTTDHGTANLGLNGMGDSYGGSSKLFGNLARVKRSFAAVMSNLEKATRPGEVQEILGDAMGYQVPEAKAQLLLPFIRKEGATLFDGMNSLTAQLGQLLANHLGISWTGSAHTGDYVPLVAMGPGAERFRGFLQNTDVFHHYMDLLGVDYENPEAPLIADAGPAPGEVEATDSYRHAGGVGLA